MYKQSTRFDTSQYILKHTTNSKNIKEAHKNASHTMEM